MTTKTTDGKRTRTRQIAGDGVMADLVRARDWSATPVGPIERWSESLLSQVNLVLTSRFPAMLSWGTELTLFYNDATIAELASLHPEALGQSSRAVFKEVWNIFGPGMESCLMMGEAPMEANVRIPFGGHGDQRNVFWTFYFIPVYAREQVLGVRSVFQNTTKAVLADQERERLAGDLAQVLEATSDGVLRVGPDWRIRSVNARSEALLGPVTPAVGSSLWDSLPQLMDAGSPCARACEQTMLNRTNADLEVFYPEPLNLSLEIQIRPVSEGIVLFLQDRTEQRRSEAALRDSLDRLKMAQDSSGFATWEWTLAADEMVWTGEVESIVGRPAADLTSFAELLRCVHPDDRAGKAAAIEAAIAEPGREFSNECRSVWPDGSIHWDLSRGKAVSGPGGRASHMFGILLDLTEHKRAEQEILTEKEKLAELFAQAPAFIAMLSGPEHVYVMVNPAYEALLGGRECLGKRVAEVLPNTNRQNFVDLLDTVYRTGEPHVARNTLLELPQGEGLPTIEKYLDFVYQPRREADGTICGVMSLGIEVTERLRSEQALIQSEKLAAVGRLASTIAHEINNPLAAVTNYLYLASMSTDLSEIREHLIDAGDEVGRISAISNQTLLSQKRFTKVIPRGSGHLVNGVLTVHKGSLVKAGVRLETRHRAKRPIVCLEGEMRQLLGNLIANATQAMQVGGGRLLVRSRDSTNWATKRRGHTFTVADTGTGISADLLSTIFEPFFTTRGLEGNGLGLWISQRIVEKHGGVLRVRSSQRLGRSGSVFTAYFPLAFELPQGR